MQVCICIKIIFVHLILMKLVTFICRKVLEVKCIYKMVKVVHACLIRLLLRSDWGVKSASEAMKLRIVKSYRSSKNAFLVVFIQYEVHTSYHFQHLNITRSVSNVTSAFNC